YTASLYVQDLQGDLVCLSQDPCKRWADFSFSPDGSYLLCICEDHSTKDPKSYVVIWDLQKKQERIFQEGADFYASPRWSPDGKKIAFLHWNHPYMPWEECSLQVCLFSDGKKAFNIGSSKESISEFLWNGTDEIVFVSDRSGFSNLYLWTP